MNKRKRHELGQHFLTSDTVCQKMVDTAQLLESDIVFEIGTGLGILTRHIAQKNVKKILSFEKDPDVFRAANAKLDSFSNIQLFLNDAFDPSIPEYDFQVCLSSIPYSRSLDFVQWLAVRRRDFRVAVVLVQSDFARKLKAVPNNRNYRAVSVMAQICFDMEIISYVEKSNFLPQPKVRSVILKLSPKRTDSTVHFDKEKLRILNFLFSYRGRLLRNALRGLVSDGIGSPATHIAKSSLYEKRIENITPNEYINLFDWLESKRKVN